MNKKKFLIGCCIIFFIFELVLRIKKDPFDIDFMFDWYFFDRRIQMQYRIATLDQESANIPLNDEGFRGRWQIEPPQKDKLRIVVTGAGHTFADNINFGNNWIVR